MPTTLRTVYMLLTHLYLNSASFYNHILLYILYHSSHTLYNLHIYLRLIVRKLFSCRYDIKKCLYGNIIKAQRHGRHCTMENKLIKLLNAKGALLADGEGASEQLQEFDRIHLELRQSYGARCAAALNKLVAMKRATQHG